jgi:hypothetical protein
MKRFWPALLLATFPLLYSARSDYVSVQRKFDLIEGERLKPGSRVTLTERELNAYALEEIPKVVPEGVREPKLELGSGSATGSAMVDFVKLRAAQGQAPGWLMRQLLAGERPVTVTARIESAGGRATVNVQSVQVSGITIEGRMLDFLIQNYLLPYYPEAKIGQPFQMSHRIDRLDIQPARVDVILQR